MSHIQFKLIAAGSNANILRHENMTELGERLLPSLEVARKKSIGSKIGLSNLMWIKQQLANCRFHSTLTFIVMDPIFFEAQVW